ncbi:secretin N-terminal domain-containing protein [Desulfogranum marinum]|uniref:secretin N-terminal domain-containing protein n=1 Tax=Desulfogranum marinum TaxID=453220 RepID=UPI0029C98E31|nr:secretin N-terminal domain-containing protein [Desulfogranum marinum]
MIKASNVLLACFFLLYSCHPVHAQQTTSSGVSVDFENATLSEVIFLVSELTGAGFVYTDLETPKPVTWSQKNISRADLMSTFAKVVSTLGYSCQLIKGKTNFYTIKPDALVTDGSGDAIGVYHLKNVSAESITDSAAALYGTRLTISFQEENQALVFSGSPGLVEDFASLLERIDQPRATDIATIRLQHISVRAAMKALTDLSIFEDAAFPDYWNRSILVHGDAYKQNVARATLMAIDQPQEGWVDQVGFVHTIAADQAVVILQGLYPGLEIREVATNRILISGEDQLVDQASVTLTKIDGTGLQVKVEAVIAYLTDREFKELGIRLSYDNASFFGAINDTIIDSLITRNTGLLIDYFDDILGLTFAAEKGKAHGQILSSPVLTVLNGQEARIHVGQNVPYLSEANVDKNNGQDVGTSIKREDVGITFRVTPSIEPDGDFIHLTVDQIVSNVTSDSELSQDAIDIILDKKEISSTVLVGNGDTIFLGGLRSEESGNATDHIPFLGELPLIGPLFSYHVEKQETRHLVVSLRVNVIGKSG